MLGRNEHILCIPAPVTSCIWGGRIRTLTDGARVRCPAIRRHPNSLIGWLIIVEFKILVKCFF